MPTTRRSLLTSPARPCARRVSQVILIDAAGESRGAPWPTRLARLPIVGDIGIYFKPERSVRRKLSEAYADPAMVTTDALVLTGTDLARIR